MPSRSSPPSAFAFAHTSGGSGMRWPSTTAAASSTTHGSRFIPGLPMK